MRYRTGAQKTVEEKWSIAPGWSIDTTTESLIAG
jgi:hypothetical protein